MCYWNQKAANVIVIASLLGSRRPLNKQNKHFTVNRRLTSCHVDGLKRV
jgi:hypothetical protein